MQNDICQEERLSVEQINLDKYSSNEFLLFIFDDYRHSIMTTNTFPLLNQIDEGIHSEDIDWNKNAFQTLLVRENPPPISIIEWCFF